MRSMKLEMITNPTTKHIHFSFLRVLLYITIDIIDLLNTSFYSKHLSVKQLTYTLHNIHECYYLVIHTNMWAISISHPSLYFDLSVC